MQDEKIFSLMAQAEDIQGHAVKLQAATEEALKSLQGVTQDALKRLPDAAQRAFEGAARESSMEASKSLQEAATRAEEAAKRLSAVWLQQGVFLVAIAIVLMAGFYFGSKFLLASTMNDLATAREEVAELQKTVDKLSSKGGKAQISSCGDSRRLCIRIDSKAGNFGDNSEQYRVIYGY